MTDTIKISRDTLEDLRDLAFDEAERHRQAMGVYRCDRQARMDATIAKADALLATPPADAADMGGQAGKLVEALRKIHFRADCFVEDDRDMPVTSIEVIVSIAGEALADWEKTK